MDFEKYHDALKHAKKTQQKGMFVVGTEKHENELEARLALAHKKFRSAVAAMHTVETSSPEQVETEKSDADIQLDTDVVSKDN